MVIRLIENIEILRLKYIKTINSTIQSTMFVILEQKIVQN